MNKKTMIGKKGTIPNGQRGWTCWLKNDGPDLLGDWNWDFTKDDIVEVRR